ncbi:MAG: GNAT family N-acetyltransferase [Lachnoclostridium sp.]|nr:GNAT family N-acetyltransferase [Lachnospira sp.]MCM1247241.1 GNAT family N-acetyltransferase [Lachnoclostridium sp.]
MEIITYQEKYKQQIIDLILHIQNSEAKINLSLEEQPDLLDIHAAYEENGGKFWLAVDDNIVIGTLALMNKGNGNGVLKKGFVKKECRKQGILTELYDRLIDYAKKNNYRQLMFDTPSVATNCHRFFEKKGYIRINKEEQPFEYEYPDRNSYLYLLRL